MAEKVEREEKILTCYDIKDIVDRRNRGESIAYISKVYGVHRNSITYHLRKAGATKGERKVNVNVAFDKDLLKFINENYEGNIADVCNNLISRLQKSQSSQQSKE